MTRRCSRTLRLLGAAVLLAACRDRTIVVPPTLPTGAIPFTPPPEYARWWGDTEACSGRTADFARVHWYVVPNAMYFEYKGELYDAYWFEYQHQIVVADAYLADSLVVRHEMLHDLLDDGGHPVDYFQQRCATVVAPRRMGPAPAFR